MLAVPLVTKPRPGLISSVHHFDNTHPIPLRKNIILYYGTKALDKKGMIKEMSIPLRCYLVTPGKLTAAVRRLLRILQTSINFNAKYL